MRVGILLRHHDGGRVRTGDAIVECLTAHGVRRFDFSVAFVTKAGVSRLASAIRQLVSSGGQASGIVGVDQHSTTREGLQVLLDLGVEVDVLHSPNDIIYHPKLYIVRTHQSATAFAGSSNMTVGGLFRNIEGDVRMDLDLRLPDDTAMLAAFDSAFQQMRVRTGSCRRLDGNLLEQLSDGGLLPDELTVTRALRDTRITRGTPGPDDFVPLRVPPAPPSTIPLVAPTPAPGMAEAPPAVVQAAPGTLLLMVMSRFDASHQRGVPGTPEVSLPQQSVLFFPPLAHGHRYPEVFFNVRVATGQGHFTERVRVWHRPAGRRGHTDYRLRSRAVVDELTPGGGDILCLERLPQGQDALYEATIISGDDPQYPALLGRCTYGDGKRWGIV